MYTEDAKTTGEERTEKNLASVIEAAIDRRGWAYAWGTPGNRRRRVGTTIGLARTFGHPELCVLGTNGPEGGGLLGAAVDLIRRETRLVPLQDYAGVIDGYPVRFKWVPEAYKQAWFFVNADYFGGRFDMLQLIWPDREGRFPGDPDCHPECTRAQSLPDLDAPATPTERRFH